MMLLTLRPLPRRCVLLTLLVCMPALAAAQALSGISSLRVAYNTRKAVVNPQGELKAQIDAVDAAITAAARSGNLGEVRRQLAKGTVLLAGGAWTPAADFQNSLVLRSERTVVDSSAPYVQRLEPIDRPDITLTPALTLRVALRPPQNAPQPDLTASRSEADVTATVVQMMKAGQ